MISFIIQEAKEKAEETAVATENEFMTEKLALQTQYSLKIREEYDRKKKEKLSESKIARSRQVTESRFSVMRRRDDKMKEIKRLVLARLANISTNASYPDFIKYLIVQGLLTMAEENVTVHCRREDEKVVEAQLETAAKAFKDAVSKASGFTPTLNLHLSKTDYLPPGPQTANGAASCCGGVKLTARNGKIVCKNTIESRLDLVYKELQPTIRGLLFGYRPAAIGKPSKQQPHH